MNHKLESEIRFRRFLNMQYEFNLAHCQYEKFINDEDRFVCVLLKLNTSIKIQSFGGPRLICACPFKKYDNKTKIK